MASFHFLKMVNADDNRCLGWVYICIPKLPVYRMPYHELVSLLRLALQTLYAHGMYLEHRWAKIRSKEGHHV